MVKIPRIGDFANPHNAPKDNHLRTIFEYLGIIFGIFPMALMVNWVFLPHAFVGGGLTGICSIIYYATQGAFPALFPEYGGAVPVWLTTLVFNLILLIIAVKTVGWRFCIRTIVGVLAISFWYRVIPILPEPMIEDPWLGAIIGGVVFGLSLGIVMACNGSSGGTDILAMIVNYYRDISLGKMMLLCDIVIILSAFLLPIPAGMVTEGQSIVYLKIKRVLCGVCMTVSYTMAVDAIMSRLHQSVQVLIYSRHYAEIATAINQKVNRGVTVLDGTGWYSQEPVKVVTVLAHKAESQMILHLVHQIDPNAFISLAKVNGVFGAGFDKIKR